MTTQWAGFDPRTQAAAQVRPSVRTLPPLPPLPPLPAPSATPPPQLRFQPEPPTPRELLVQRMVGAALMLVLLSITGFLWNLDWLFRVLFTVYTGLVGYWFWDLFVRHPRV